MARAQRVLGFTLFVALSACQAPPAPQAPVASPGAAASAAPASSAPAQSPVASTDAPIASPSVQRLLVTGQVYDDTGAPMDGATVTVVEASDASLKQQVPVLGGSYVLNNLPVGARLTLRAAKDGYTPRERMITVDAIPEDAESDPNQTDFGGPAEGMLYALSQYPEISRVEPANQQTGVSATPLRVTFHFSHPIRTDDFGLFERLVYVRFPVRTTAGVVEIRPGAEYDGKVARMGWSEDGSVATFEWEAPIVTREAEGKAVVIGFDDAAIDKWPRAKNGKRLGRDRVFLVYESSGATVTSRIAPFNRGRYDATRPSARPSPEALWGLTHAVNSTFSLAAEAAQPRVVSARSNRANGENRLIVTFDRPVRGFPEAALDGSAVKASNYRIAFGRSDSKSEAERFKTLDPATNGQIPESAAYSTGANNIVVLTLPAGILSSNTQFKLYVDPAVKDIAGNGIKTSPPDPATALADNVLLGDVQ